MKILVLSLLVILGLSFIGCNKEVKEKQYYDRANDASKESLRGLDRDTE